MGVHTTQVGRRTCLFMIWPASSAEGYTPFRKERVDGTTIVGEYRDQISEEGEEEEEEEEKRDKP